MIDQRTDVIDQRKAGVDMYPASTIFGLFLLLILLTFPLRAQTTSVLRLNLNGQAIHYIEKGTGEPLILLHGGLFDYRSWESQFEEFAKKYRVISYSRRYSFPNNNALDSKYRPAISDAEDLKNLINQLGLKKVHLVGLSYGAFTGLIFAVENPGMVASMVLAEPPAHQLVRDLPGGDALYLNFLSEMKPMVEAFRQGDDRRAIVIFNKKMGRDFEKLPPAAAASMLQNVQALKAINLSAEPFPSIDRQALRRLAVRTLVVKGERADQLHASVSDELARLLPNAKTIIIPSAGHNTPRDNPPFFNSTVLSFLESGSKSKEER